MPANQEEFNPVTPTETTLVKDIQPPAYYSGTTIPIINGPLLSKWKINQETEVDQGLCYGLRTLL